MLDRIKKQLVVILNSVSESKGNIHYETGETLNVFREKILGTLDEKEKELMTILIKPLTVEIPKKGDGEWTVSSTLAKILCNQLLEILNEK